MLVWHVCGGWVAPVRGIPSRRSALTEPYHRSATVPLVMKTILRPDDYDRKCPAMVL
jgi:hypothetical protein